MEEGQQVEQQQFTMPPEIPQAVGELYLEKYFTQLAFQRAQGEHRKAAEQLVVARAEIAIMRQVLTEAGLDEQGNEVEESGAVDAAVGAD